MRRLFVVGILKVPTTNTHDAHETCIWLEPRIVSFKVGPPPVCVDNPPPGPSPQTGNRCCSVCSTCLVCNTKIQQSVQELYKTDTKEAFGCDAGADLT